VAFAATAIGAHAPEDGAVLRFRPLLHYPIDDLSDPSQERRSCRLAVRRMSLWPALLTHHHATCHSLPYNGSISGLAPVPAAAAPATGQAAGHRCDRQSMAQCPLWFSKCRMLMGHH